MKRTFKNEYALYGLILENGGGPITISQKSMERAQQNDGVVSVDRRSSGVCVVEIIERVPRIDPEAAFAEELEISEQAKKIRLGEVWPDETRIDIIAANGPTGEHYDK